MGDDNLLFEIERFVVEVFEAAATHAGSTNVGFAAAVIPACEYFTNVNKTKAERIIVRNINKRGRIFQTIILNKYEIKFFLLLHTAYQFQCEKLIFYFFLSSKIRTIAARLIKHQVDSITNAGKLK